MRTVRHAIGAAIIAVGLIGAVGSGPAMAACKTFKGTHNGTDLFHPTGAKGAAINHALNQVERWKIQRGLKRVRMGTVRAKCGPWFNKYFLPHRHCVAKVRACG